MSYWITRLTSGLEHENQSSALFILSQATAETASELGYLEINYELFGDLTNQAARRKRLLESLLMPVQADDVVVVQFPLWTYNINFQAEFVDAVKKRGAKVVGLLHDVISYMQVSYEPETDFWLEQFRKFDLLIVANQKLARRLKTDHIEVPMVEMFIWDYRYNGALAEKKFKKELVYVGGRQIQKLDYHAATPLKFYGRNDESDEFSNLGSVEFLGRKPSQTIISELGGGFGLVESENIKERSNFNFSEYNKWNNPTKLSLYLAAGLPLVVSPESPHADWILEQGIGLVVGNLNDIDQALAEVTAEDYQGFLDKVKPWQEAVSIGFFVKRALLQMQRVLELGYQDEAIK